MSLSVSDHRSNHIEQIEFAARAINKSKAKLEVFKAIYYGKQAFKTVDEIASKTGMTRVRVLQAGGTLKNLGIVTQSKIGGQTAYGKDNFFGTNKAKIIKLAENPKSLSKLITKRNVQVKGPSPVIKISVPKNRINARQISIDEIDSFSKVKGVKGGDEPTPMPEKKFKEGMQRIISEAGKFTDWGGEMNDLLTTRVRFKGSRIPTAFALKGPGKKGRLVPGKMGKKGDQIQRLFASPATLHILQYWDKEIDDSVVDQMLRLAQLKSVVQNERIYFCVIDGIDSNRILKAYPRMFKERSK